MSIIGEGKYVNYVGMDSVPSWQKYERYDYCERPVRGRETLASLFKGVMKLFASSKTSA